MGEDYRGGEPTNHYSATRPYRAKHGRAKLDIGGEKKCVTCVAEEREMKRALALDQKKLEDLGAFDAPTKHKKPLGKSRSKRRGG